MLAGEVDADAAATWLEVDPRRPCRVVAVSVREEPQGDGRRLADLLLLYFSAYRHRVLPVVSRGRLYLIACDTATGSVDTRSAQDTITRAAAALRLDVHAVVGPVAPTLEQVAASRDDADRGLRVLAHRSPSGTAVHDVADLLPAVQMVHLAELVASEVGIQGAVPCSRPTTPTTAPRSRPRSGPGWMRSGTSRWRAGVWPCTPTRSDTGSARWSTSAGSTSPTPTPG